MRIHQIFAILTITLLVSCNTTKNTTESTYELKHERNTIVSAELIHSLTASQVKDSLGKSRSLKALTKLLKFNDIEVYRITYNTPDPDGNNVIASGALIVPKGVKNPAVISYQHGTINEYYMAPSEFDRGIESVYLASFLGASGFVVSLPDYIGYGSTKLLPHPYDHVETMASSSFDMLNASLQQIDRLNIQHNNNLFITGYSQGGNATMGLHKYIEDNSNIKVSMNISGSGPYNKLPGVREVLEKDEIIRFIAVYLWAIESYNNIYDLGLSWKDILNDPYATIIDTVQNPMNYLNIKISENPQELFREDFRKEILNGGYQELWDAFEANNTNDWLPEAPVKLIYGTEDKLVLPSNSISTYEHMKSKGADVELIEIKDEGHFGTFPKYVIKMYRLIKRSE